MGRPGVDSGQESSKAETPSRETHWRAVGGIDQPMARWRAGWMARALAGFVRRAKPHPNCIAASSTAPMPHGAIKASSPSQANVGLRWAA